MRQRFTRCDGAIVARPAGTDHIRVIDRIGRRPDRIVMAILTNVGCVDMSQTLAGGRYAIVATGTVTRDARVIERRRDPAHRCMAVVAGIGAAYMRQRFTGRDRAIVARPAGADHIGMIDRVRRRPDRIVVAILTNVVCVDVS